MIDDGQNSPLREALEATRMPLKYVTVLAECNDPFRLDTPANHRDGLWLANTKEKLGIGRKHNRGLHYAILGQIKPNGLPYTSSDSDWDWLGKALDAARWLGYIHWEDITDERNLPPVIREWTPPDPKGEIDPGHVSPPYIESKIQPAPVLTGMIGKQLYHLAIFGEKSSLAPVLNPISYRYNTDLYLPTGEISDTMLYQMAKSGASYPCPMIVFCISDCDPSGWQMPISIARKLQAFKVSHFPNLTFQVRRAALRPKQARDLQLPSSPLKETETRADKWEKRMGVEQIEIDALATLNPEKLHEIVIDAIMPFYDDTLAERVAEAEDEWLEDAQSMIDEHIDQSALDAANKRLAALNKHIASEIAAINAMEILDNDIELPEIEVPEADDNSEEAPTPLIDSRWNFENQCRRLIQSKQYKKKLARPEYDDEQDYT